MFKSSWSEKMYLLRMPKADENMAEGTVLRWLVKEGDCVADEENMAECLADKGSFEIWSEADGVVLKIFAPEKSVVPVGYVLAAVGSADEEMPDIEAMNRALLSRMEEDLTAELGEKKRERRGLRATPAARRLAREKGIALEELEKLGTEGLIREEHVRKFLEGA